MKLSLDSMKSIEADILQALKEEVRNTSITVTINGKEIYVDKTHIHSNAEVTLNINTPIMFVGDIEKQYDLECIH